MQTNALIYFFVVVIITSLIPSSSPMMKHTISNLSNTLSRSLSKSSSSSILTGIRTRLEEKAEKFGIPFDEFKLSDLEKKLDKKIKELKDSLAIYERNLQNVFNLVGVQHQNVRSALEMALAYEDIFYAIYPQLVLHNHYYKQVFSQSKMDLQEAMAEKKRVSKLRVPMNKLDTAYQIVVDAKFKHMTVKDLCNNLKESIEKIQRDYEMIELAENGKKKLLDLFYQIKDSKTETIYQAFFMQVFPKIVQRTMEQIDKHLDSAKNANHQSQPSLFLPALQTIHPVLPLRGRHISLPNSGGNGGGNQLIRVASSNASIYNQSKHESPLANPIQSPSTNPSPSIFKQNRMSGSISPSPSQSMFVNLANNNNNTKDSPKGHGSPALSIFGANNNGGANSPSLSNFSTGKKTSPTNAVEQTEAYQWQWPPPENCTVEWLGEGHKKLTSPDGRIWEMLPSGFVGFLGSPNGQPIILDGLMWPIPKDCKETVLENGNQQFKAPDGRRWEMLSDESIIGFQWNEQETAIVLEFNANGTLKIIY